MDAGTTLKHLAPFLIPILALLIPIVAIAMSGWGKVRRNRELHETIRQLASRGQAVPPELLNQVGVDGAPEERRSGWNRVATLRGGLINAGVGIGLMIFFYAMRPNGWLWAVGAIPLCLGVAMLVAWKLEPADTAADGAAERGRR
jgi:Domain of unknown function (DUF6249)